MFYPDCIYANMKSNRCKEGFIMYDLGEHPITNQQKNPSKATQKSCFHFVQLILPRCPSLSRSQRQAWFAGLGVKCGCLSTAAYFKHKMKDVIALFPSQSPAKRLNRKGESGVLMHRTCENTDCVFWFLGTSVWKAQVRTGPDACPHYSPSGLLKYSVFKADLPPPLLRQPGVECCLVWTNPSQAPWVYVFSKLHQCSCWHWDSLRGNNSV